jgi:acetylornithine aminotransferase
MIAAAFSGTTSQWNAEELEKQFLVPTYTPNGVRTKEGVAFVTGKGSKLYDQNGKEYVDWAAGIAVNSLGHNDPDWIAAVTRQASKIAHVSNLFHTYEPLHLAKMMVESSKNFQKVFFCNSGTEANEAALKFARKVSLVNAQRKVSGDPTAKPVAFQDFACKSEKPASCFTKGGMCSCWPQAANNDIALNLKTEVVAFKHSFHGRSMGALAATHKPQIRQPFGPFAGDVKFARFNNIEGG